MIGEPIEVFRIVGHHDSPRLTSMFDDLPIRRYFVENIDDALDLVSNTTECG